MEIWSIGHGARELDEFLDTLREARIALLADVRSFPGSRRHPQFGAKALAVALAAAGLEYVHLVGLGRGADEVSEAAGRLYGELREAGAEVIYDDRDAGPGEKLTDAELLGCPLRVVIGKRTLAEGAVETQVRRTGDDDRLPVAEAATRALELLDGLE